MSVADHPEGSASDDRPVVLVTGCSSGIGYQSAKAFADAGCVVFAGVRSDSGADALRAESDRRDGLLSPLRLDVSSDESVALAVATVVRQRGRIDVLVNNAGISGGGPVEEVPDEVFRQLFETNVFGVLRMLRATLPTMRQQRSGTIINISSASARVPGPFLGPYAASKSALEALSEALYFEVAEFGIHVRLIEAAAYRTEIMTKSVARPLPEDSAYSALAARIAETRGQIGEARHPSEVAQAIVRAAFAADDELRVVVGEHTEALLAEYRTSSWQSWAARVRKEPGRR